MTAFIDPITTTEATEAALAVGAVTAHWWIPFIHPDVQDYLLYGGAVALTLLIIERGVRIAFWAIQTAQILRKRDPP